jgi:DNA-binding Lrp family transcriptional regulator
MRKHNGMRPQDIVVLLKIIALKHDDWYNADLARSLKISPSEISEVLNRCKIAGLIDSKKRKVNINSFMEFLVYGLKYVFPTEPGAIVKGIPTAHSASPINEYISSGSDVYVWASAKGTHRGQAIEPLFKSIPQIVQEDKSFYELLAIVDTIRVGKVREINIAKEELEKQLKHA